MSNNILWNYEFDRQLFEINNFSYDHNINYYDYFKKNIYINLIIIYILINMQRSLLTSLFLIFLNIFAVQTIEDINEIQIEPLEKDKLLACSEIVRSKFQLDQVNLS